MIEQIKNSFTGLKRSVTQCKNISFRHFSPQLLHYHIVHKYLRTMLIFARENSDSIRKFLRFVVCEKIAATRVGVEGFQAVVGKDEECVNN